MVRSYYTPGLSQMTRFLAEREPTSTRGLTSVRWVSVRVKVDRSRSCNGSESVAVRIAPQGCGKQPDISSILALSCCKMRNIS